MNKTTLTRLFFLLISAVLAFTLLSIPLLGGVAATPAPESNSLEQIPEQQNKPHGNSEIQGTRISKRLESVPLNNPHIKTSETVNQETFYSLADSYIVQDLPAQNFGHNFDMFVGSWSGEGITRSLIFFHIESLPSSQNILGATLRINYLNAAVIGPDYARTISTHRIVNTWAESLVTWENAPAFGEAYGSKLIALNAFGWHEFDVTDMVRSWYDGTYQNYGIMLLGPEVSGYKMGFSSREGAYIPELIIQYEPVNSPPTIAGMPDQDLPVDTNLNNAIDLWAFANDAEDADSALSFTINNTPNSSAGVSIDSNRYIDINPSPGWTGVTNVEIKVTDTGGLSDIDSFQVKIFSEMEIINLPIVIKN